MIDIKLKGGILKLFYPNDKMVRYWIKTSNNIGIGNREEFPETKHDLEFTDENGKEGTIQIQLSYEYDLIKKIRKAQYYALLSVDNVCFNNKEFNKSLAEYKLCCILLDEKEGEKSLDELGELLKDD